jgi:hypothetical protein
MSRRLLLGGLGAAMISVGMGVAVAQTPPVLDMKGTWTGTGEAIVDGASPHHLPNAAAAKPVGNHRLHTQTYTYKIEGQEGRRFWGTTTSDSATDRLIGSLSGNGKWLFIAANRGIIDGEVIDNDTIEICYREASPDLAVVGCGQMKRQK